MDMNLDGLMASVSSDEDHGFTSIQHGQVVALGDGPASRSRYRIVLNELPNLIVYVNRTTFVLGQEVVFPSTALGTEAGGWNHPGLGLSTKVQQWGVLPNTTALPVDPNDLGVWVAEQLHNHAIRASLFRYMIRILAMGHVAQLQTHPTQLEVFCDHRAWTLGRPMHSVNLPLYKKFQDLTKFVYTIQNARYSRMAFRDGGFMYLPMPVSAHEHIELLRIFPDIEAVLGEAITRWAPLPKAARQAR